MRKNTRSFLAIVAVGVTLKVLFWCIVRKQLNR